jgi:hypothetical protein
MGGDTFSHFALSGSIRRRLKFGVGCGLTLVALTAASAGWAATYRWVDERGKVHYGDSIPPAYVGQGHTELNNQGRVIKRTERALSSDTMRAKRAQEEAEKREARDRRRRDNALLATYASSLEIEQMKKRALEQEQTLLTNLQAMRKHAGSKSEAEHIDAMVRQRHKAMEDIRGRYDADLARYVELTGRP